ncbi:diguanylate cyclase (GGDEF) domain-containing protein [Thiovulum sp. ES]|nr:diguanylate cyclase (GGDEF) domain-containing protein [Thiovulum sp. ES]
MTNKSFNFNKYMDSCLTILIVDDEVINIEFVSEVLSADYNIKIARNGKQAINVVKRHKIDLILLDVQMPEKNGYETAEEILSNPKNKNIPIIFLTSNKDNNALVRGFRVGAKDYITKPFNVDELKARTRNQIKTYLLQKEIEEKQKFLDLLLNAQSSMITLASSDSIHYANKSFLDFFGYSNFDDFYIKYNSLIDIFVKGTKYFSVENLEEGESWINKLKLLNSEKRVVAMENKLFQKKFFQVGISDFHEDGLFVINFTDISNTIEEKEQLEKKVTFDKLTGAYTREHFDLAIPKLIKNCMDNGDKIAFSILDIDFFKKVNDTYGHDIGDEVLKEMVKTVKSSARSGDMLIRWGGEEFILVLSIQDTEHLHIALEKFRKAIENKPMPEVGNITCSFGGTLYNWDEDVNKSIKRADEALYNSKRNGRNQVTIF